MTSRFSDLNGDGRSDIVWSNPSTGQALVSLSTGTGFAAPVSIGTALGAGWEIAAIGDFNGDGKADLIWSNRNGQGQIWLMNGLTVTATAAIAIPQNDTVRSIGDFNADGRDDIVLQDFRGGTSQVLLMNGVSETNRLFEDYASGYVQATGDIDGDRQTDLISQDDRNTIVTFPSATAVALSHWPFYGRVVGIADVNHDGKGDVIMVADGSRQTRILLTDGRNAPSSSQLIAGSNTSASAVRGVGDYDGDGQIDLLWDDRTTGLAELWRLDGQGAIVQKLSVTDPGASWIIAGQPFEPIIPQPTPPITRSDFNGDKFGDILWQSRNGEAILWTLGGTYNDTITTATLVGGAHNGPDWKVMGIGDVNGDGKSDIVWENISTGQAVVWTMDGGNVVDAVAIGAPNTSAWQIKAVGDANGDGKADIVWDNVNTGQAALWTMDGTTVTSGTFVAGPQGGKWQVVGMSDIDNDGKADLLLQDSETGVAVAWLMDGAAIRNAYALGTGGPTWHINAYGDFDANGTEDIFWQDYATGKVVAWSMQAGHIASAREFLNSYSRTQGTEWQLRAYEGVPATIGVHALLFENTSTGAAAVFGFDLATYQLWTVDPVGNANGTNLSIVSAH